MKAQLGLFILFAFLIIIIPISSVAITNSDSILPKNSANLSQNNSTPTGSSSLSENPVELSTTNTSEQSTNELFNIIPNSNNSSEKNNNAGNADNADSDNDDFFNILNQTTKKIDKISYYDYVVGSVASEMPATYDEEALKAQAVASFTYALHVKQENAKTQPESLSGADFSADPSNFQGYMTEDIAKKRFGESFDEYYSKIKAAVDSVFGEYITYDDEVIVSTYHAISSGKTESAKNVWGGDLPYLQPVDSSFDIDAKNFSSQETFSSKEVKDKVLRFYPSTIFQTDKSAWFSPQEVSDSDVILKIMVGDKLLYGSNLRTIFNLRSSSFTVSYDAKNDTFTFDVSGYGHGVGLSQNGANYLAEQGKSHLEILEYFYGDKILIQNLY